MAVEPVQYERFLLRGRPGRDHPEVPVDLHGIGIDDDPAEPIRQADAERRLA